MNARESFAKVLKELRLEQGLSQEKLAEQARLSTRTISLIECNKLQPTISTIDALAKALGVKISEMMVDVEKHIK